MSAPTPNLNTGPVNRTGLRKESDMFMPRLGPITALLTLGLLTACSSPSDRNITLASSSGAPQATAQAGSTDIAGIGVRQIKYVRQKPGCISTCPSIEVDSIAIARAAKLTQLIDHALAYMTGIDPGRSGNYQTLQEYEAFFWATAQPRDVTTLRAFVRDVSTALIGVELGTTQMLTGAAHGITATQFLNWERDRGRVLALDEALVPGQRSAFDAAVRRAHARWKTPLAEYQRDPAAFDRMWPYQPTDNFAFTAEGMIVKYDAYAIAPYALGQPELTIPYSELSGIVDARWLAR